MNGENPHDAPPWQGKCGRRLKQCRKCHYRFRAGDRGWTCPTCQADRHCLQPPEHGIVGGACRRHGGLSLKGPSHPAYKDGRFSRYLPTDLASKFDDAANDENLLHLKDELALIRMRQGELAGRLESNESEKAWAALAERWGDYQAASHAGDKDAVVAALAAIGKIIRHGAGRDAAWRDLVKLALDRAAILKAEAEINQKMQYVITPEQAERIFFAMCGAVRDEVTDPAILSRISARFMALHGRSVNVIDAPEVAV